MIHFTHHAIDKFDVLERHGVAVTSDRVIQILREPELVDRSRMPLLIAQGTLDEEHVLRVVFKKDNGDILVITFYPARKAKYEKP